MKLALVLNNFYPYGGLEKSFMGILRACVERGHEVQVFAMSWQGEMPQGATVHLLSFSGVSNHGQARSFVRSFERQVGEQNFDLIVGFNRMPGLDLYYNADVCYVLDVARRRSFLSKLTPRYRTYAAFEEAVFGQQSPTHVMSIAEREQQNYQRVYGTPSYRFHPLPAGIDKESIRRLCRAEVRADVRREYGVKNDEFMLLMIGSDFRRKGVARAIASLAALPTPLLKRVKLFVVGQGKEKKYRRQAQDAGLAESVVFLGGRTDVPRFLVGADVLLHPAISETAGNAILEAMVAGLAVLVTEECGFAFHVAKAKAGCLIPAPFRQEDMNATLMEMLQTPHLHQWAENGYRYADEVDLYSRAQTAVTIIESLAYQKQAGEL